MGPPPRTETTSDGGTVIVRNVPTKRILPLSPTSMVCGSRLPGRPEQHRGPPQADESERLRTGALGEGHPSDHHATCNSYARKDHDEERVGHG